MSTEERVRKIYRIIRQKTVAHLPVEEREAVLKKIYGPDWTFPDSFPKKDSPEIRGVLEFWYPNHSYRNHFLQLEEYRRLEDALSYQRRTFCLDLDGLVVDDARKCSEDLRKTLREVRKKHALVISTAAPRDYAIETLAENRIRDLLCAVFGDLGVPKGKRYLPIVEYFGYAFPDRKLVAVGHGVEDVPADIEIPFILIDAPEEKIAEELQQRLEQFL